MTDVRPGTAREPQLDTLVRVMLVNLAVGLVVAAITLVWHRQILDFQLAALGPADRGAAADGLSTQLWSRPGPAVAVALLYPLFIRRLREHRRSAYRRVLIVSVLQIASLLWFVLGGSFPWWLHAAQVVQLVAVAAVLFAASRRAVRELFPRTTKDSGGNAKAAWFLVFAAPLIAEVALGSTPPAMAWLVVLWVPVYGAGVLLIRELVVRTGRGWPSLVVLGIAYEILEDGVGLQALTSPKLYDAAHWGVRFLGLNLTYWQANALYHVVFSVLIPITLANLVFPAHRNRPYVVHRRRLYLIALAFAAGVALVRFLVVPSQDPGYQTPTGYLIGYAVAVVVLGVVALRLVPRRGENRPATSARVPSIGTLYAGTGVLTVVAFALVFRMLGAAQPAFAHGLWVLVPMVVELLLLATVTRMLVRFGRSAEWTGRHVLAVCGGALAGHTLAGMLIFGRGDLGTYLGLAVVLVVTVLLVARLDHRLRA
ncbi:hypothetical protein ACIOD2_00590 [Amycolatopsis sp. NPDC088138]|uniref:hypothetical protein n=1 Tax=Amycolatopsis sp. NPDC088138 TaxID=3363938 RepID=UPI003821BDFA